MPRTKGIAQIVKRCEAYRPRTAVEFRRRVAPLFALSYGAFREVYKVNRLPVVVKFPSSNDGRRHSQIEMSKLRRLQKIKWMQRFLPTVYYYCPATGVIVMRYYRGANKTQFNQITSDLIRTLFKRATGVQIADYHDGNVRLAPDRKVSYGPRAILIDIGY